MRVLAFVGLALLSGLVRPSPARAQACCAAAGVVVPARLRVYEDYAVGVQARQRQTYGTFAADGRFDSVDGGDLVATQVLFAAARVLSPRLQLGVSLPYVESYRHAGQRTEWGGFFGDAAADARVDVIRPGDFGRAPAVIALAGVVVPTGRPPEEARNPLGTDAAGTGSYQAMVGLEIESVWEAWFASADATMVLRTSRPLPGGGTHAFSPRLGLRAAAGRAFGHRAGAALVASAVREGAGEDTTGGTTAASATSGVVSLVTAGVAGLIELADSWRLNGTLALDLPLSGWGRNMPATMEFDLALLRVWP